MKTSERRSYSEPCNVSVLCREDRETLDTIERLIRESTNITKDNPFCGHCMEESCDVDDSGLCNQIRLYIKNK